MIIFIGGRSFRLPSSCSMANRTSFALASSVFQAVFSSAQARGITVQSASYRENRISLVFVTPKAAPAIQWIEEKWSIITIKFSANILEVDIDVTEK
jgi:hypothetical protein